MAGVSALVSLILFLVLSNIANTVAENYCFYNDIPMTEFDWMDLDRWIFSLSAFISCCSFSVLFLCLLNDKIAYIRRITNGINDLRTETQDISIPLEGSNELTVLADSINYMSAARKAIRKKEQALAHEKEQLLRSLSHDIRTPLTSILAYSDYLQSQEQITAQEQKAYIRLIQQKSAQIRDMTAILLDGSKRDLRLYEDGKLLFAQITEEFVEGLEDRFTVSADLSNCPVFSGTFDVGELRRIFDNLSSNVLKYADPKSPVFLSVQIVSRQLLIHQSNAITPQKATGEGLGIGLNSIRRIAQLYGGNVSVEESADIFGITVTLSDF